MSKRRFWEPEEAFVGDPWQPPSQKIPQMRKAWLGVKGHLTSNFMVRLQKNKEGWKQQKLTAEGFDEAGQNFAPDIGNIKKHTQQSLERWDSHSRPSVILQSIKCHHQFPWMAAAKNLHDMLKRLDNTTSRNRITAWLRDNQSTSVRTGLVAPFLSARTCSEMGPKKSRASRTHMSRLDKTEFGKDSGTNLPHSNRAKHDLTTGPRDKWR